MANVGKNIKRLRTNCKMTQDALAEQLFVSRQTVSNYENGKSNPDIGMLIKMAEIFGTDVNTLIYRPPVPVDRKREYWKLAVMAALVVVVGVAMVLINRTGKLEWYLQRFVEFPANAMYMVVYPVMGLLLGWTVMQAAGIFLGAKHLSGKAFRVCFWVLIGMMVFYVLMVIPTVTVNGVNLWRRWLTERSGTHYDFNNDITLPWQYSEVWAKIWWNIWIFNKRYSAAPYIIPGILLWATTPQKKKPQQNTK